MSQRGRYICPAALILGILACSTSAFGAVSVSPTLPSDAVPVTITVDNHFGAQAVVISATMSRAGNAFTIVQNVGIACHQPSDPAVTSQFEAGALPSGTYTVIATINFEGVLCSPPPPLVQSLTFNVGAAIPVAGGRLRMLLAVILTLAALVGLRSTR